MNIKIKALDGLDLDCLFFKALNPIANIQIIHGMVEHKERYLDFINFLVENGFNVIISDLRGHGKSLNQKYTLGHIERVDELVSDQYEVTKYIKKECPNLDLYMFAHSMGTLVARTYIRFHDTEIKKLILSGVVAYNPGCKLGVAIANMRKPFNKYAYSKLLWAFSNDASFNPDLSWLSYNEENIKRYSNDPLCTFKFDVSANYVLFKMVWLLKKKYKAKNTDLKICLMSGEDDRTTLGKKGLEKVIGFLLNDGYKGIKNIVYPNMKHEILQEDNKMDVYNKTLEFFK